MRFYLVYSFLTVVVLLSCTNTYAQGSIHIHDDQLGSIIDGYLWGTNLTNASLSEDRTIYNPDFVSAARHMGVQVIRWPGGNNADAYDWKREVMIRPGRRISWKRGISLPEIAAFARQIGAALSITINFGTMTPQDAADLVEYCNGPATSTWGAVRASHGFEDPLDVRFFEIGNEINQPHQWFHSWTAEDPYKYFFGGSEERRGSYQASENLDPVGKKGDFFKVQSDTQRTYFLRFPPVKKVRVFWTASEDSARNDLFEEWHQVDTLANYPPDARVFTLDSLTGTLHFGDGNHGASPPLHSYFLVEYTTYGHAGFVSFARAMRSVPSSVPIQIGSVMLPIDESNLPIVSGDSLYDILSEIDYIIYHKYNAPFNVESYQNRRQIAYQRSQYRSVSYIQDILDSLDIDKTIGIGITEWNIFLDQDWWHINRTLEGAVIAGEYFIRTLNAQSVVPVWIMHQFALGGTWLSLYNNWTSFSIAPMGYVFKGFETWRGYRLLPVEVVAPLAPAYDRSLPVVQAAAALSMNGDTMQVALVNNAETDTVELSLNFDSFGYTGGVIKRLEGSSYGAHNESNPFNVILQEQPFSSSDALRNLKVAPHSVMFLELYRGAVSGISSTEERISTVLLQVPYPSPANNQVVISYYLPEPAPVTIAIYTLRGEPVAKFVHPWKAAGWHQETWHGSSSGGFKVASGVYLCRISALGQIKTQKIVWMR